uniref:Uncharacterized protein LOC113787761 n=1 Tax=Cicer arietinum TaxID=3827 RepID=A0A3Q7Y3L7_CICAR|nr:uncharacterized protein LOC113787761 [Cicer arietinum]
MRQYYSFRLQQRAGKAQTLLRSGRLLQQYMVDAYASIEEVRINWIRKNQKQVRAELYNGLRDVINQGDVMTNSVGRMTILPSSYTGGPRYRVQNYQDAMAICRYVGYPDLFLTFTCNPKWPEIQFFLETVEGQKSDDRPDIISRVFPIKLWELINHIKRQQIFGKVTAVVYTVEFQKRVERFMIHGPCGILNKKSPCMVNGKCGKHYPKRFHDKTSIDEDGFPIYMRRNGGRYILKNGSQLDSRYVVPYNRHLLIKYDAHINVELCNRSRSIKYLFKYINKGPDRIDNTISAEIPDKDIDPLTFSAVERFMIHGPCGILNKKSPCMVNGKCGKHYPKRFHDKTSIDEDGFPIYMRRNGGRYILKNGSQLDSRYVVPYNRHLLIKYDAHINVELCNRSRSIKYLFKYINKGPDQDACYALGLLEDDKEFDDCIKEAAAWGTGIQLRQLFSTILLNCTVINPEIQKHLRKAGKSLEDYKGIAIPNSNVIEELNNRLITEELNYDMLKMHEEYSQLLHGLNSDQKAIHDFVLQSIT